MKLSYFAVTAAVRRRLPTPLRAKANVNQTVLADPATPAEGITWRACGADATARALERILDLIWRHRSALLEDRANPAQRVAPHPLSEARELVDVLAERVWEEIAGTGLEDGPQWRPSPATTEETPDQHLPAADFQRVVDRQLTTVLNRQLSQLLADQRFDQADIPTAPGLSHGAAPAFIVPRAVSQLGRQILTRPGRTIGLTGAAMSGKSSVLDHLEASLRPCTTVRVHLRTSGSNTDQTRQLLRAVAETIAGPRSTTTIGARRLAKQILDRLDYEEQAGVMPGTAGAAGSAVPASRRHVTHCPTDHYAAFNRLIETQTQSPAWLLLLIDPLNDWLDPNQLRRALTSIKAMLAHPGVSAVLVLPDGMTGRASGHDATIDSICDDIICLAPWTKTETHCLANQLVLGLPTELIDAIWAMAAGLPGDIRRLIDLITALSQRDAQINPPAELLSRTRPRAGVFASSFGRRYPFPLTPGDVLAWGYRLNLLALFQASDAQGNLTADPTEQQRLAGIFNLIAERVRHNQGSWWLNTTAGDDAADPELEALAERHSSDTDAVASPSEPGSWGSAGAWAGPGTVSKQPSQNDWPEQARAASRSIIVPADYGIELLPPTVRGRHVLAPESV
ncbi:MAG: hypothetical protein LBV30_00080 [Propionibacteriaceae bacterium]|jgi:hypothetical protein|nr:hypothetical protein [Propionibacteriaceae bacterium]